MSKTALIIQHEYWERVKNKSFIIMTLLGPFILALLMIVPIGLNLNKQEKSNSRVMVIDGLKVFKDKIPNTETTEFFFEDVDIETAKRAYQEANYDYILYISPSAIYNNSGYHILSHKTPSKELMNHIQLNLESKMTLFKLNSLGVNSSDAEKAITKIHINYLELEEGSSASTEVQSTIGLFAGVLIYFFICMYGIMIMKAVMTEKQSRIIEIIVSSAKPFEIMMGKIVGVLLAGLTQFIVWMLLSSIVTYVINLLFIQPNMANAESYKSLGMDNPFNILQDLQMLNFPLLLGAFIIFFILGFLLYGSIFASIGAAVSKDSETQQFVFPLTTPLLLSFIILPELVDGANSGLTSFLSYCPFTSPVIMLVRIMMEAPLWEVLVSIAILIVSVIVFVAIVGKIYKAGILMHGQKVNYSTIKKWIFSK